MATPTPADPCQSIELRVTLRGIPSEGLRYSYSASPDLGRFVGTGAVVSWQPDMSSPETRYVTLGVELSNASGQLLWSSGAMIVRLNPGRALDCRRSGISGQIQPDYRFFGEHMLLAESEFVPGEALVRLRSNSALVRPLTLGSDLPFSSTLDEHSGIVRMDGSFRPQSLDTQSLALENVRADSVAGRATLEWIAKLRTRPDVEFAEPNLVLRAQGEPSDPLYSNQRWQYEQIKLPAVWQSTGGQGVNVAVLDSGIYWDVNDPNKQHSDFACHFAHQNNVFGWDFVDNDGNPYDNSIIGNFHGTHVAGVIAACANSSGIAGVAPGVNLIPVRVINGISSTTAMIVKGLRWAAGLEVSGIPLNPRPAQVINISLGGIGLPSQILQSAIDDAVAQGATIVVAAGNDDGDASLFNPANQDHVIVVGASGPTYARASYSNTGPLINVLAPGGDIVLRNKAEDAVFSTVGCGISSLVSSTCVGGGSPYSFEEGTSAAAPHVAGVIALMLEGQRTDEMTWLRVLSALMRSAQPHLANCERGCGAGLLDASAALQIDLSQSIGPVVRLDTYPGIFDFGESQTIAGLPLRNIGDMAAHLVLNVVGPGLSVDGGGELAAGASTTLTIRVDRTGVQPGQYAGLVEIRPHVGPPLLLRVYYEVLPIHGPTPFPAVPKNDIGPIQLRVYRVSPNGRELVAHRVQTLNLPYEYILEDLPPGLYDVEAFHVSETKIDGTIIADQYAEMRDIQVGTRLIMDRNLTLRLTIRELCPMSRLNCP